MILLHQHIAYPSPALSRAVPVTLPSSCSAETCELAAIETAAITSKYLRHAEEMMLNSDFVFCAFVAARALLGKLCKQSLRAKADFIHAVHSHYCGTNIATEFYSLVENLEEMSQRWRGCWDKHEARRDEPQQTLDLAGR